MRDAIAGERMFGEPRSSAYGIVSFEVTLNAIVDADISNAAELTNPAHETRHYSVTRHRSYVLD